MQDGEVNGSEPDRLAVVNSGAYGTHFSLPFAGRQKLGFSLIETAIVLGVVGAIVAGLYIAAQVAQYRIQINQGSDEVGLIVGNMRSLYASQNASAVASQGFAAATPVLMQQGIFPREMLSGGVANNPWDQTAAGGSAQIQLVAAGGGNPARFVVRYLNIPAEVCADILVHTSLPGAETGLLQIVVGATTYTSAANQLPVTPLNAAAACPAGALYTIDWYYSLGS